MLLDSVTTATWSEEDSEALLNVFRFVGQVFTMEFNVMGFTTNLFQIIVTMFFIVFLFRFVGGLMNSD